MNSKKWEILHQSPYTDHRTPTTVHRPIVDILLKNRGIKTEKEKKEFFNPTPAEKLSLKELGISQKEIGKAANRLKQAINDNEKIVVYGDYDADGVCATAILWECLEKLGADTFPYIPERFSEGYGLKNETLKRLKEENPGLGLIFTVDQGIVANKQVDFARDLGIDVVITDHHQPGKTKPRAQAIIHSQKISGSAVAWIVAKEIVKKFKNLPQRDLELVAIGTVADQLPLIGANRSLLKYGLEELKNTERLGLLSLFEISGLNPKNVTTYHLGFVIAPRINAMGRMGKAIKSLELLCTRDERKAKELALNLNKTNIQRQQVVKKVVTQARETVRKQEQQSVIVLASESYHEGVIGLVASRLVAEFYRPTIILAKKGEVAKASARSIPGFNIIEAIRELDELLIEGGGHPMAAGFSISTEKIEEFRQRFNDASVPQLTTDILTRRFKIDLELDFSHLNWELEDIISSFEPTGLANPRPIFLTKNVKIVGLRNVGNGGKHLQLKLENKERIFEAIAFNFGNYSPNLSPAMTIDVVYSLEENVWNGNRKLQLKIKDLRLK